jgi:mono/diheme cytochrome c family protein
MLRRLIGVGVLVLIFCSPVAAAAGAAIYKVQGAQCHGDTGKADTTIGKAMKVPPIVGDANIQKMSAADVVARIKSNDKHPPTVKGMSAEDIDAVAAHIKELAGQ